MAWVDRISTTTPAGVLAYRARADVAQHGMVVLLGGRAQARQLRRLQAALRAGGYQARYLSDGSAEHVLVMTAPGQEMPRVTGWWGGHPGKMGVSAGQSTAPSQSSIKPH
jgi:hypothetical protein